MMSTTKLTNMQYLIASVKAVMDETGDWRDYPCLLWDRGLVYGYGQVSLGHTNNRVHRVAWKIANGEITDERLRVCHRCDVRNCFRPIHLFLGTDADNMQDMVAKKRDRANSAPETYKTTKMPCGENHHRAKLNTELVLRIRQMHAEGMGQKAIGQVFGMRQSAIFKIVHREIWKHV